MPKAMPYLSSSSGLIGPTFRPKLSHLARKSGVKVPWSCEVTPVYGACQVGNARYCVRKVPPQVPSAKSFFSWGLLQPGYKERRLEPEKKPLFFVEIGDLRGGPAEFCSRPPRAIVSALVCAGSRASTKLRGALRIRARMVKRVR